MSQLPELLEFLGTATKWVVLFGIILLVGTWFIGCTSVTATLPDGTSINVVTIAQSRQDIDVGRDKNGAVHWKASDSSPDQTLAQAILNLTEVVTKSPVP